MKKIVGKPTVPIIGSEAFETSQWSGDELPVTLSGPKSTLLTLPTP